MKVVLIEMIDGRKYYCKHDKAVVANFTEKHTGKIAQMEELDMTDGEYWGIPATCDSAEAFANC